MFLGARWSNGLEGAMYMIFHVGARVLLGIGLDRDLICVGPKAFRGSEISSGSGTAERAEILDLSF